jgi:hypothetical protein
MKRYPWARNFIKQARLFSVFVVICAFLYVGLHYLRLRQDIQTATYKENPELRESFRRLMNTLSLSETIASKFIDPAKASLLPAVNDELPLNYNSLEQLNLADTEISKTDGTVQKLKDDLMISIREDIDAIVLQLRAYATAQAPASPLTDISNAEPKPAPVTVQSSINGLFSEDVTQEEAQNRQDQLKQVTDVLRSVLSRTQKPENQSKIKHSISQIHDLSGLLAYLTAPAQLAEAASADQNAATPDSNVSDSGATTTAGDASKTADLLEQSEGLIEDALTSKWQVDADLLTCKSLLSDEEKVALAATEGIRGLWISFAEFTIVTLVLAFVGAYLVQILSDLLQAHIDNAENSFVTHGNGAENQRLARAPSRAPIAASEVAQDQLPRYIRISKDGVDLGEISILQFKSMVTNGELSPEDHYYDADAGTWHHIRAHPEYGQMGT